MPVVPKRLCLCGEKIRKEYAKEAIWLSRDMNRPLAKLGKAVKIADASNQGKAKCETVSAVTIAFREDTKPFEKADSVFNKDTYFRDFAVIFALLLGQRMILGTLFRQKRIGVYQGKALVSSICLQHRFCLDMDTRILE